MRPMPQASERTTDPTHRCCWMLCRNKATGAVSFWAFDGEDRWLKHQKPVCEDCANIDMARAVTLRMPLHLTPGGAIYAGPMDRYLPRDR